jgi:hypothetical protein
MICPVCTGYMEPIGYSIFDITYGCAECSEEKDVPIDFGNVHIVRAMKKPQTLDELTIENERLRELLLNKK